MDKRTTLKKTLKPHWVWAIALGSAIGWGAFVQPINWMKTAGPLGVIIGMCIGAGLMMLIAVSYGLLIKEFPVSGGEFAYAYISLGRTHAFICGWFLTLGYISIVALNASALSLMIKYIFPSIVENVHLYTVAGWDVYLVEILIATASLIIFGYLNIKGTGFSGRVQFFMALFILLSVAVLAVLVGIGPETSLSNAQPYFPKQTTTFAAIVSIVAIAPWAYVGFDTIPQAAEEFDFPAKKAFNLIIFALIFSAIIYSVMVFVTAIVSPWEAVADKGYLWGTGTIIQEKIGTVGLVLLVLALTMGVFTGLNGFIMGGSRVLFAMARAKILPGVLERVHGEQKTPHIAIIFTIIISAIAPWFGRETLEWVVDMSSIGVSIAYFYTCLTAFQFFVWSEKGAPSDRKYAVSPVKKTISLIGVISSITFVCLLLVPGSPAFLGPESRIALLIWVALGLIFYFFKRKEYQKIPKKELDYLILGDKRKKI